MKPKVILRCPGFIDRRGPREFEAARALEQARADNLLEARWRANVAHNWKERARVLQVPRAWLSPKRPKGLLARQAD